MHSAKLKRTPVQERSNETLQQILGAASALLAATPPEQITTSRIAAEAGVSIGGLYRFFPDKQAIFDAIAVERVKEFQDAIERRLGTGGALDGRGLLETMIDVYVEFLDGRPDFRALALGRHVSALTREQQVEPGAGPASLVRMFLMGSGAGSDPERLDLQLRVAIEAGERLIDFAFQQTSREARSRVIEELKSLLAGYLF